MKSVYFIRTRENRPYILVTVSAGSTDFQPLSEDADDVTQALDAAYQKRAITENELEAALDDDLKIEGPVTINRTSREQIADFLEEAQVPRYQSGTKPPAMALKSVYSSDVADMVLDEFPSEMRPNIIEYKAMAFLADQTKTTFNYEVKRVRAMWDPTLSIPGTNRRGGWRCPVGTRYGGQITDRFGRNCGWGVARRIANAITNIGERMEDVDDRRRGRRVARRNERMIGRLQRDAGEGGRLERGLRGVAERLDGGETPDTTPRNPQGRGRGGLFGDDGPLRIGPVRMPRQPQQEERQPQPQRRRANLRDSEARRMEREVVEPNAPRTEEEPRPPRQPRAPRRRGRAAEPDATTRELGDAPRQGESYDDYVGRKYAEYQARIAEINQRGGRAGLLTRDEWYKFNRSNLREAWGRANGGEIPNEDNIVPRPAREPRPRAPRRRRVNASNAQAAETANRRPRPEDQPIPQQRPTSRPNRVRPATPADARQQFVQRMNEQLAQQKREAIRNIPADATPAEKREYKKYVNELEHRFGFGGADSLVSPKSFNEWRNDRQPPAPPRRPRQEPVDLGGSMPDNRSERNVYNQFRERGLPETAYWREENAEIDAVQKAELERRFGRYYDNNNQRNARGDYVNEMIRRRGQQPAPQGRPPEPPARPQAPAAPPQPPVRTSPPEPPARPQGRVRRPRRQAAQAQSGTPSPTERQEMLGRMNDRALPGIAKNKQDRLSQMMGHAEVEGLLIPQPVPRGNKNINTQNEARDYVKNGGSLDDVPDKFLKEAIMDNAAFPGEELNGRRFQLKGDPNNGINNRNQRVVRNRTYSVTDTLTGKRYILKTPSYGAREFIGEQYAEILGQIAGRPMSRVRLAGDIQDTINNARRTRNVPLLIENFGDVLNADQVIEGAAGGVGNRAEQEMSIASRVFNFIDSVTGNADRHANNYMWAIHDGKMEKLPIDHGLFGGFGAQQTIRIVTKAESRRILDTIKNRTDGTPVVQKVSEITDKQIDAITEGLTAVWNNANPDPNDASKINIAVAQIRQNLVNLREAASESLAAPAPAPAPALPRRA